jgi:hypothetical protein
VFNVHVRQAVEEEVGRSSMALELLRTCLSGVREPAVDALLACDAIGSLKPLLALRDPAVLEGALAVISLLCVPFEGKETAVRHNSPIQRLCGICVFWPLLMMRATAGTASRWRPGACRRW